MTQTKSINKNVDSHSWLGCKPHLLEWFSKTSFLILMKFKKTKSFPICVLKILIFQRRFPCKINIENITTTIINYVCIKCRSMCKIRAFKCRGKIFCTKLLLTIKLGKNSFTVITYLMLCGCGRLANSFVILFRLVSGRFGWGF